MEQSKEQEQKTQEEKETSKKQELSYASNNDYLDDCIDLVMKFDDGNKYAKYSDFIADIENINSKVTNSAIKISFEEKIKNYNFSPLEKFLLWFLGLNVFIALRSSADYSRLLRQFIQNGRVKSSEVINMLSETGNLRKSKCIKLENGDFCINKDLYGLLTGIKNAKKSKNNIQMSVSVKDKMPKMIYEKIDKYVISQNEAKKSISSAACEHLTKCKINAKAKTDKLDKTNTLIIGGTGTGKTYLCQVLADVLQLPFHLADMSKMSESGYVGDSVDTVITRLSRKIDGYRGQFPPSIIYLDEIDKICEQMDYKGRRDIAGTSVQQELLKLIESNKYSTFATMRVSSSSEQDISNIMFIAGGAFVGLDKIIKKRLKIESDNKRQIGFISNTASEESNENILQRVIPQDLIEYGFMPELIGRFSNIVVLEPLSEDDLISILSKSKNNVFEQYKKIFKEHNIDLEAQENLFREVAQKAIKAGTGARGLKNILAKICGDYLFEIGENKDKKITITNDDLKRIA